MKHNESFLTAEHLRSQLSYNSETGSFSWRNARAGNKIKSGDIAGFVRANGYREIGITIGGKCRHYSEHRLAWLYVYGIWPNHYIDHIDRNRSNNKISNLREATNAQNCLNRSKRKETLSRYVGVSWFNSIKKWRADIRVGGKLYYLGKFDTERDAAVAYNKYAIARDPSFNNLNIIE